MKKLIISLVSVFFCLLIPQIFAIHCDRDVYGVYIETESKEEQKKIGSFLSRLEKKYSVEVVTDDLSLKTKREEFPKHSFLSKLEFVRPPNSESSSTYVGKSYDQLTDEYIGAVSNNIDSDSDSTCQGYVFVHTSKLIFDCNLETGNVESLQMFMKNIEQNIEKIVKNNKNPKNPLVVLFVNNKISSNICGRTIRKS